MRFSSSNPTTFLCSASTETGRPGFRVVVAATLLSWGGDLPAPAFALRRLAVPFLEAFAAALAVAGCFALAIYTPEENLGTGTYPLDNIEERIKQTIANLKHANRFQGLGNQQRMFMLQKNRPVAGLLSSSRS